MCLQYKNRQLIGSENARSIVRDQLGGNNSAFSTYRPSKMIIACVNYASVPTRVFLNVSLDLQTKRRS